MLTANLNGVGRILSNYNLFIFSQILTIAAYSLKVIIEIIKKTRNFLSNFFDTNKHKKLFSIISSFLFLSFIFTKQKTNNLLEIMFSLEKKIS